MKIKLLSVAVLALVAASACGTSHDRPAPNTKAQANATQKNEAAHTQPTADGHAHGGAAGESARVPAFEADPEKLPPTLAPEAFTGKTRLAYQAVREIPRTIAQLPCYCHCDRAFGHKSLHSCYVDGHASSCAVCVEEVLLAYRLEKEQKLTPEQIRERIIAEYSTSP